MQMPNTTASIGTIVERITSRFDAATASGEWPDRPLWQQPPPQPVERHAQPLCCGSAK
jgi:hypothetical protein